jgi:hypothetical protein
MKKTATILASLLALCSTGCEEATEMTQVPVTLASACDSSGCEYVGGGSCRFNEPACRTEGSSRALRIWGTDLGADGAANASAFCASMHGMPNLVEFVESTDGESGQSYVSFDLGGWTARASTREERDYSILASVTCAPN